MLQFKALTLEDKPLIDSYIKPLKFLTCEYSFTTLYIWRTAMDVQYCIYKGALIIRKLDKEKGYFFMQPVGYKEEDLQEIVDTLVEYKKEHHMEYLFQNIEEPFLSKLKDIQGHHYIIEIEENNFDYIYETDKLIDLPGRKLASKRNHINKFISTYNYRIDDITSENAWECIEASRVWCKDNDCTGFLSYEMSSIADMLTNKNKLDYYGIAVYVDNEISAFTIGEKANDDMAIIHIEKAFSDISGIYAFINKTFAEKYFRNVRFINREDDMGLEGLRKAKESYHPFKLEYKYMVKLD